MHPVGMERGGVISYHALHSHSKSLSFSQTKRQRCVPRATSPEATDFALPQPKFNTSAMLTSLLGRFGQISLHDHHLLPVLNIRNSLPTPRNLDRSGLDGEKLPEASWSSVLPSLWGLCRKASVRSGFFFTLESGSVLRGWHLETRGQHP